MNENGLASETIRTVSEIVRLLERESAILNAMKPGEIADFQVSKGELVSQYETQLEALAATPDLRSRLAPALHQELAHAVETLRQAVADNQQALTAARMATDQLVQSIASAVVEEERIRDLYRADGRKGRSGTPSAPVAVSFNQVL